MRGGGTDKARREIEMGVGGVDLDRLSQAALILHSPAPSWSPSAASALLLSPATCLSENNTEALTKRITAKAGRREGQRVTTDSPILVCCNPGSCGRQTEGQCAQRTARTGRAQLNDPGLLSLPGQERERAVRGG